MKTENSILYILIGAITGWAGVSAANYLYSNEVAVKGLLGLTIITSIYFVFKQFKKTIIQSIFQGETSKDIKFIALCFFTAIIADWSVLYIYEAFEYIYKQFVH